MALPAEKRANLGCVFLTRKTVKCGESMATRASASEQFGSDNNFTRCLVEHLITAVVALRVSDISIRLYKPELYAAFAGASSRFCSSVWHGQQLTEEAATNSRRSRDAWST
jgi:hypothetical protein